ncbi:predicted protein [Nematostella vectensis]|uniref:Uncharacterized protein n=2 Tax=Nematostella vectensis TaxID=45351 RepID=A7RK60_NEMVE|nr:predicted protein [Nematostella vectensis]|eukprot:XP_001640254.1 predicted protein [Nematostella vectensis]
MLQMGPTPHLGLTELAKSYGEVFRLKVGSHRIVVVNSIEAAREALVRRANDFAGRPMLYTASLISRNGTDIAFGDFGPLWKQQRKIAHSALRMFGSGLKPLEEKITVEADELIKRLSLVEGRAHNPKDDVNLAVLNIICSFVFGSRYDMDDPEFHTVVDYTEQFVQGFRAASLVDYFPWLRHLPNKGLRQIKEACQNRDVVLQKKYQEHLVTYEHGVIRDLTDALLSANKASQEESAYLPMTEDHIIMTMNDIFSAGLETTATSILWSLVYLIRNPKVQEQLHQQIDEVVGRDRAPELSDRENLPLIEATIAEVLRSSSLVPLLFPHSTTTDTHLRGYEVPKDTIVLFNVWNMHHDPQRWSNPDEFDPTRFLDDKGKFICPATLSYLPFSAGRRVCLAESLGKMQLFLFISRLLHKFRFSVPPNGHPPSLEGVFGASLCPKPFRIVVEKRS